MPTRRDFLLQTALGAAAASGMRIAQGDAKDTAVKIPMNTYKVPHTDLVVSRLGYGCGSLGGLWDKEPVSAASVTQALTLLSTAYDNGITLFDHADIYGYGKSEAAFGEALSKSPGLRNKIVIQSKCGIRLAWPTQEPPPNEPHHMDFSYAHIVSAVEGSLQRLCTDRLDILLLHRPDALMEPDEVAKAFDELHRSGKVRYFGVSNHTPAQIELLRKSVRQPLVVNQIQIGLGHSFAISEGIDFNRVGDTRMADEYSGVTGVLDYCRLHDIQVQAWSPLRGVPLGPLPADATPQTRQFAQTLGDMAITKHTVTSAIALAWLLRHPAGILPITGPTNPDRLIENCMADRVVLSREEWYTLWLAAAGFPSQSML